MLTSILSHQQSSIKRQLDELTQPESTRSNESAAQLAKLRSDILQAVEQLKNEDIRPATAGIEGSISGIRESLEKMSSMISSVPKENIILANLYFASMTTRASEICAAETGTFEWILQEELGRTKLFIIRHE
jgi:hypothetical protein